MTLFASSAQSADLAKGYKVIGWSGLSLRLSDERTLQLEGLFDTLDGCLALASGVVAIEELCRRAFRQGQSIFEMAGSGRLESGNFTATLKTPDGTLALSVRAPVQGQTISLLIITSSGIDVGGLILDSTRSEYLALAIHDSLGNSDPSQRAAQPRVAFRRGDHGIARLTVKPTGPNWDIRLMIDAKGDVLGYDEAWADCMAMLTPDDDTWLRQCEKAIKDKASYEMAGIVRPAPDKPGVFIGEVATEDQGFGFPVMLQDPQNLKIGVALAEDNVSGFDAKHEVLYFAAATGTNPDGLSEIDIAATNWRIPQERLAEIGLDMELAFNLGHMGYEAEGVIWFDPDPAKVSGYCPESDGMSRLCEKVAKDGPLSFSLFLGPVEITRGHGWSGSFEAVEYLGPDKSWRADVFQGRAIGDWGDEDPDKLYIRLLRPDEPVSGRVITWIELEPMGREVTDAAELQALAAESDLGISPAPPPSADQNPSNPVRPDTPEDADICETFDRLLASMPQARSYQLLKENGFWGGIVADTPEDCDRAVAVLESHATLSKDGSDTHGDGTSAAGSIGPFWPAPGEGVTTVPIGRNNARLEFTIVGNQAAIRVPEFEQCTLEDKILCKSLKNSTGNRPVTFLAKDRNSFGIVILDGNRYGVLMYKEAGKWRASIMPVPTHSPTFDLEKAH